MEIPFSLCDKHSEALALEVIFVGSKDLDKQRDRRRPPSRLRQMQNVPSAQVVTSVCRERVPGERTLHEMGEASGVSS